MRSATLPYPQPALPPTEPLPVYRALALTEPPEDDIATTHRVPVVGREQNVPTMVITAPSPPRGIGWLVRIAVSFAIVVAVVIVVLANYTSR